MSRVGKHAVKIPASVTMSQSDRLLSFKSSKGSMDYNVHELVKIEKVDGGVLFSPLNTSQMARSLWGTTQRNVANIVHGLDQGFTLSIELVGVGYRAAVNGKTLQLQLGYSHDINYPIPDGITIQCEKPTSIKISGASKQQVGQVGAYLSSLRPPEPYKGKGVIRENVFVVRKEGKKK